MAQPVDASPAASDISSSDRVPTVLLGLALFAFYVAIQRGEYVSWDGRSVASVAFNIWEHGRIETLGYGFPTAPGAPHDSVYGIGMSAVLVPFWGLQRSLDIDGAQWLTVANPIVLAVTGALLFRTGIALGLRRSTSVGMGLVFGTLTMAPMYSTELFSEPAVTLGTVLAVLGCIQWRNGKLSGPWCLGVGVAIAIVFRTDAALLVGITLAAVPLFVPLGQLRRTIPSWFPAVAIPIGSALAWLAYYNHVRYGSFFIASPDAESGFTNPLLDGVQRQLASPGKGFFWYNPILVAAVPGTVWLFRRDRAVGSLIVGVALLRVLLYAKWPSPDGSIAWGPRFLLPWCALLTIPLGVCWERIRDWNRTARAIARTGVTVLAVLSFAVVIASVWVSYAQYWGEISVVEGVPPEQAQTVLDERIEDSFNSISGSPLLHNLRNLADAEPFGLRWFRDGPTPIGIVAAAVAVVSAALAVAVARGIDTRPRGRSSLVEAPVSVSQESELSRVYERAVQSK